MQTIHSYENGYGASVINYGYGSQRGYKELAILHNSAICYATPLGEDVFGWRIRLVVG